MLIAEAYVAILFACGHNPTRFALRVLSLVLLTVAEFSCAVAGARVVALIGRQPSHDDLYDRMVFWAPWKGDTIVHAFLTECEIATRHFL